MVFFMYDCVDSVFFMKLLILALFMGWVVVFLWLLMSMMLSLKGLLMWFFVLGDFLVVFNKVSLSSFLMFLLLLMEGLFDIYYVIYVGIISWILCIGYMVKVFYF